MLSDILQTIEISKIVEIWCLNFSCSKKNQFVVLMVDGLHRCTCNMLITHGYPCRHFYKILRTSSNAKWHIGLISTRWYKDSKLNNNDLVQQTPISLCIESPSDNISINNNVFNFEYLKQVHGNELYTPALQKINDNRQKYGRAYGLMKEVIDIAINTNLYDELIGLC